MNAQAIRCLTVLFVFCGVASAQPLLYVDVHPLQVRDVRVEDSTVSWQKIATAVVENRSGLTTATAVVVRSSCTAGGRPVAPATLELGTLAPRQSVRVQLPVTIPVAPSWHTQRSQARGSREVYQNAVDVGTVRCHIEVLYDLGP